MIRSAGIGLSLGRRCLQNPALLKTTRPRHYSKDKSGGASMGAAAAGLGVLGVGGGAAAYYAGYLSPASSSEDQKLNARSISSGGSASLSSLSAPTLTAKESVGEESYLRRKKKTRKETEETTTATTSAAETASSSESVPEHFTAIPPSSASENEAEPSFIPDEPRRAETETSEEISSASTAAASASESASAADAEAAAAAAVGAEATPESEPLGEAAALEEEEEATPESQLQRAPVQSDYLLESSVVGRIKELELESAAENRALETILREALEESTKAASEAVVHLADAADVVKDYTVLLKKALDDTHPKDKKTAWEEAVQLSMDKEQKLIEASEAYNNAKNAMVIALQAVEGGRQGPKTRDNPELLRVEEKIHRLRSELEDRQVALEKTRSDARIMKSFTDLVEQGKRQFNAELKALMPDIKLDETGSKLSEAELNLLIAYAHRWIMQLQRQLAEYQLLEEQRLRDALAEQRVEDETLAAMRLREALADQISQLNVEKERAVSEVRREAEESLLSSLKRQAAAHSQHLAEVLAVQEEDYNNRLKTVLTQGIASERTKLEELVSGAFERLKGIESAVESRAEAESRARAMQDLWIAVAALKAAVIAEHRIPLGERVSAVLSASGSDFFVSALVDSIPEEAKRDGVYSDAELKARFTRVREIAKRVSKVTEEGGLFQTLFSFLNYKITNESVLVQPAQESGPKTDNMLELICHAQWYVEHDDLESALRCMNQLRGEPRRTAFDWIAETRTALETRQAISALYSWVRALNVGTFPPELISPSSESVDPTPL